MSLMNIFQPTVQVHIMTGEDALKKASEWQKSFERERIPPIVLFREIRKGVVVVVEIDSRAAYTIRVLADGAEAQDSKGLES